MKTMTTCLEACVRCARACEECWQACLGSADPAKMVDCMRFDVDCAQLCWTTAGFISRRSPLVEDLCWACADVCDHCAVECAKHEAEHCRRCAAECRQCADECRAMASSLSA